MKNHGGLVKKVLLLGTAAAVITLASGCQNDLDKQGYHLYRLPVRDEYGHTHVWAKENPFHFKGGGYFSDPGRERDASLREGKEYIKHPLEFILGPLAAMGVLVDNIEEFFYPSLVNYDPMPWFFKSQAEKYGCPDCGNKKLKKQYKGVLEFVWGGVFPSDKYYEYVCPKCGWDTVKAVKEDYSR